jgi:regulator of RNase E activity RraB
MTEKQFTELTKRAFDLGFRQGYEIANRTPIDENTGKDEFRNMVLETALNSLESTVFESISAELDLLNEKYPAFDGWKVFSDGVIHGAGENFLDRTGNEE